MFAVLLLGVAQAKLPPPSDEQKAKVEEAKSKAADATKIDADLLGLAQDRVAAGYIRKQKAKGIAVKPTAVQAPSPPALVPAKK